MKTVKIATFLSERKIKMKPAEANKSGLQRIEKIDFDGNIYLAPIQTNTDMITVKKGDLVISGINVEKGALAIYHGEEDVLASIHYSAYAFDKEQIDIIYLKWFLKSRIFKKLLLEQTGSGIKKEIKAKHLLPIEIELPSLKVQQEIVKKILSVEHDISFLETEITRQEKYVSTLRQSILQQAVEGKLCEQDPTDEPASILLEKIKAEKEKLIAEKKIKKQKDLPPITEEEKPFNLPQGWEWCRFVDIIEIASNLVMPDEYLESIHLAPDNIEKNTGKLLTCNTVFEDDVKSYNHLFFEGQIVYSKIRPALKKAVIAPFNGLCSADMYPLNVFCDTRYVHKYLLTNTFTEQVLSSDNRVKMPKTNQNELSKVVVPLPPLAEQKLIVEKVDRLMVLCDQLEQEVTNAKKYAAQLMEAVLQEAFSGKAQPKQNNVIEFKTLQPPVTQPLMAAARGKMREGTWERITNEAMKLASEES